MKKAKLAITKCWTNFFMIRQSRRQKSFRKLKYFQNSIVWSHLNVNSVFLAQNLLQKSLFFEIFSQLNVKLLF